MIPPVSPAGSANQNGRRQQGVRGFVLVGVVALVTFTLQGCGELFYWASNDGAVCPGLSEERAKNMCMKCHYYSQKAFYSFEKKRQCQEECEKANFAGCEGFLQSPDSRRAVLEMQASTKKYDNKELAVLQKQHEQKRDHSGNGSPLQSTSAESQEKDIDKNEPVSRAMETSVVNSGMRSHQRELKQQFVHGSTALGLDGDVEQSRTSKVQKSYSASVHQNGRIVKTKRASNALTDVWNQMQPPQAGKGGASHDVGRRAQRRSLANVMTEAAASVK